MKHHAIIPLSIDPTEAIHIANGGWFFQWCCTCQMRHVWNFQILRGKKPSNDVVVLRVAPDAWGTTVTRRLLRQEKANMKHIKKKSKPARKQRADPILLDPLVNGTDDRLPDQIEDDSVPRKRKNDRKRTPGRPK